MHPVADHALAMTRRHFFQRGAVGLGAAALASLAPGRAAAEKAVGSLPELPHFAPKAKRAIYLFMSEGPSQMDLWDYKPKMAELFDKDLPESIRNGQRLTTMTSNQSRFPIAPSKYKFARHGKCGRWASELLPYTSRIVDDLAVVKSVWTRSEERRVGNA